MSTQLPTYQAGAANECITPNEPLWLAGYAARTGPARGKMSDLYASALALEDVAGNRFVIAALDVIAITPAISKHVFEAVADKHGLGRDQLLFAPSHTHYGPEFRIDKVPFFKIPPDFAEKIPGTAAKLAAAVIRVIDAAIASIEPVCLFVRTTSANFAHNRRRHGVVGGTASIGDVVDHDVPVLECVNDAGERTAIVFGYACHNTTIPWQDSRYCGDWAGFAKEQLQRANPGTTALFIPGAGADQDPEPHGSLELAQQHGQELADAVQSSLAAEGLQLKGPIRTAIADVSLPLQPITPDTLQAMLDSNDPPQQVKARFLLEQLDRGEPFITSYDVPIQVIRFGDELLMIAFSGEPVVDWSHKLKQLVRNANTFANTPVPSSQPPVPSPRVWIAGYCNDMFGYLPTRRVQAEGGYEGGRASLWSWIPSPFTDDAEARVTVAVRKLLNHIS
jgi:hypothetical protein